MSNDLNKKDLKNVSGGRSSPEYFSILQGYDYSNMKSGYSFMTYSFNNQEDARKEAEKKAKDMLKENPLLKYIFYKMYLDGSQCATGKLERA